VVSSINLWHRVWTGLESLRMIQRVITAKLTEIVPLNFQMIVRGKIEMWNPKYKPQHIYY